MDAHPFAPENSMKRMGIVCCCVLTLVLLAVPLLAQQSPAAASPATPATSASSPEIPPSGHRQAESTGAKSNLRAIFRGQRLDAGERGAGADDDRAGSGSVLRWAGAAEEHAGDHDAEFRADGADHGAVGAGGIQPVLRRRRASSSAIFNMAFLRGVGAAPEPGLCRDDSTDRPSWFTS